MRIFQRTGSPFWWYDFTIRGNRHRGSTGETSERKAKVEAYSAQEKAKRAPARQTSWKISEILGTWWDQHAQHTQSADAIWSNIQNLERCLDCNLPLARLDNDALIKFRARRRGEGVQPSTINRDLSYLQAAIRFCDDMHAQVAPKIHWSRLKYKEPPARIRFAAIDEYRAMLAAADAQLQDIVTAAVATGLRKGNLKWKWHQVDLRGLSVTIPLTKGRKPIIVKITPALAKMLTRRRTAAAETHGVGALGDINVFDWTNFRKKWERLRRDMCLVDFRWHDLRHTFGTWARKSGVDLPTLMHAMAHKDIKTTMRYAHVEAEETATAFDKVAARLAQSTAHSEENDVKSVV